MLFSLTTDHGVKNCKSSPRARAKSEVILELPVESHGYRKLLGELCDISLWAFTRTSKVSQSLAWLYYVSIESADPRFAQLANYIMSKAEGLAIRAIRHKIQAEQEKAFAAGQAGGASSSKLSLRLRPKLFALQALTSLQPRVLRVDHLQGSSGYSKQPHTSAAAGKCLKEEGMKSPSKKNTKYLAQRRSQSDGGYRHYIEFLGDSSSRRVSEMMIAAADCFFFPQYEDWLNSLLLSKFYEMSISILYRVFSVFLLFL